MTAIGTRPWRASRGTASGRRRFSTSSSGPRPGVTAALFKAPFYNKNRRRLSEFSNNVAQRLDPAEARTGSATAAEAGLDNDYFQAEGRDRTNPARPQATTTTPRPSPPEAPGRSIVAAMPNGDSSTRQGLEPESASTATRRNRLSSPFTRIIAQGPLRIPSILAARWTTVSVARFSCAQPA